MTLEDLKNELEVVKKRLLQLEKHCQVIHYHIQDSETEESNTTVQNAIDEETSNE